MHKTIFEKYVLNSSDLIRFVISSHLLIEHILIKSLEKILPNPEAIFNDRNPTFFQIVNLCEALNIITTDFSKVLKQVNTIRNKCAHRIEYFPDDPEINKLLVLLREMEQPFLSSFVEPNVKELAIALSSICGYLEKCAKEIGVTDLER